ncbi:uncharacterized protein B0J16DRAFT_401939 [Fusarium flagelliforme]|uniref:uncharacterized protein n=1 Tax=Fusarium flagelliforme TaxID=2675880 RepID=UPI001E8CEC98|nr:uncharacterized protein B0J16DRAFT_401939 [Fusarium flagelliforme]KAH7183517.1 hypothetical protein B0J16DRAFT_401939 [Fusarium flagelliforme]
MNKILLALALASVVTAAPLSDYEKCQKTYSACVEDKVSDVICKCDLAYCIGEVNARTEEFCSSATASLAYPSSTKIPGGCNPAHPGSCPPSYFSRNGSVPITTITLVPGGCNPKHPGSCPTGHSTKTHKPPVKTLTSVHHVPGPCEKGKCHPAPSSKPHSAKSKTHLPPTKTPIPHVPGGCSPAHPKLCAPAHPPHPIPTGSASHHAPAPTGDGHKGSDDTTYSDPTPIKGKTWTIKNLTRYCDADEEGCDYNFAIEADGETEQCTIIRNPGSDSATESWTNEPCNDKSNLTVSWGYVTEPGPAFAVVTVVKGKILAWFGVADINGQKDTPSSPFGSGDYGNLGPEQVYTY